MPIELSWLFTALAGGVGLVGTDARVPYGLLLIAGVLGCFGI